MQRIFLFSITLFLCATLFAQTGKVFDNLSMKSSILNSERKYAIYLPPDYEISQRSYPVLYLLHGGGDDQTAWIQYGEVMQITDKAINEGKCTPMVIVMPDANTGQRGYFNSVKNDWRYEDFFFEEFMPYIEKTYRIRAEKQYRAISGNSMGGGGTLIYALHHPELFSSACPLSTGTSPVSLEDTKKYLKKRNGSAPLDSEAETYYKKYCAMYLINNMPGDQKQKVRWYVDCGDDDYLYEGNSQLHIAMSKNEIPHEYRVRDGKHGWVYWRVSLPEVLDFISQGFHK
ncbi:MAG: 1,4-beta-xylanase [Bacteroidetes bacterium GWF2_42_66]|nr:MAG: 1,4-beta-xylanase [Bacteroidetes bacterium GWA2_42_15]OFY00748.1 MAG: 1,4-beta-xylanase [Bacteroidetes bacterium GWE2_42_39]OFY40773.1 MAG: 1,4-beta-xylanase [Bacteroidetes bacterium GWF2_42_66]HBL75786.1 1,4-beta-xylanase [Prolixibacteraceae bacterium]HCU63035.1 1,4-beta-xylanase [Prolixibacteraceae bacterium]